MVSPRANRPRPSLSSGLAHRLGHLTTEHGPSTPTARWLVRFQPEPRPLSIGTRVRNHWNAHWTDVEGVDPVVVIGAGRAHFRVADLLALARLLGEVEGVTVR